MPGLRTTGILILHARRKCLLPSAPRVRLRTLNRTSYESKNAMTNEPTAARAASTLRNFSIWGPPIESSAARARDASQGHFTASARTHVWQTQFLQTFVRWLHTRSFEQRSLAALPGQVEARICVFKLSQIAGAIRNTMSLGNDASRVNDRKRGRPVSGVVKCPGL